MKKKNRIFILGFSLFLVTFGVSAATILYSANNVTYSSSSLTGNNVKDALDNLVDKCSSSNTTCPVGMTCTDKTDIKCKRATTLHTEICSNSGCQEAGYSLGDTITYGNQAFTEGALTAGDAFDCDVNGDGTFDAATERFYYINDYYDTDTQGFNDKYAVLIYYSIVRGGIASTVGTAYNSSGQVNDGPVTAREQLPTTTQWSNITLYKDSRPITNSNGTFYFSYAGYAARLLTIQENYYSCIDIYSTGLPSLRCQFEEEGTNYANDSLLFRSFWLENLDYSKSYTNGTSFSYLSAIGLYITSTNYGVRPAIEIPKSQILY